MHNLRHTAGVLIFGFRVPSCTVKPLILTALTASATTSRVLVAAAFALQETAREHRRDFGFLINVTCGLTTHLIMPPCTARAICSPAWTGFSFNS
jgi:hypothetical protein